MRRLSPGLALVSCLVLAWALAACAGPVPTTGGDEPGLSPTTSDTAAPSPDDSGPPFSGDQPSPRASPGLFYEPVSKTVILFGGGTGSSAYADTWAYDPVDNRWTALISDGEAPAGRSMLALAYDSTRRQALVFGGGGMDEAFADTWAYDPAAGLWSELEPSGDLPPARWASGAVYDVARDEVVLFGGGGLDGMLNDTWAYDPERVAWSALDPPGSMPGPRGYFDLVMDPDDGKAILFGGGTEEVDFNDTWAYDPARNAWMELAPTGSVPEERSGYAMIYDSAAGRMILFGGFSAVATFNDTWTYDPAAGRWTELTPEGVAPDPRAFHAMAYDPEGGRVFMFGGFDGNQYFNDTWAYDPETNTWTELIPATGEALQTRVLHRPLS